MIVPFDDLELVYQSLRTLEPPHTHKFPRVNAQDCKLGPIQPWDVKDFLRPGRGRARLQNYSQYAFTIEGHADERGTREYNIALGARRAQTVRDYLASHGVNPQRMRTISYGKERPVAVCNDISCWSQNRRAVTLLDASS